MMIIIIIIIITIIVIKIIVIEALGLTAHKLPYFLDQLKIKYSVAVFQKSALLGAANIMLKMLSI